MRQSLTSILVLTTVLMGCKNLAPSGSANLAADPAIVRSTHECDPLISETPAGISLTSMTALLDRARNPVCKTKILRLPLVRQTKGFTCGAASLMSILFYFGDFFTEMELQRILKSHKDAGTSFDRILRFLNALNVKSQREKMQAMYGFDSHIDLNDLAAVLNDPAVKDAIRARADDSPVHANVLSGIDTLNEDAVDIDSLGSTSTGMALVDQQNVAPTGRRVQARREAPTEGYRNKYSTQLFVRRTAYNPSGSLPEGCPEPDSDHTTSNSQSTRGMTFDDIKSAIDAGHPVLALTQAWSYENNRDYDIDEYSKSWGSGHYVAVIGYDQNNIIFMDPYNMGHYAFVPKSEWDRRWHDYDGWLANDLTTRCPGGTELEHLGLVIKRAAGPAFDVDAITKMY